MPDNFEIKASDIDVSKIMQEIKDRVEKKKKEGVYDRYNLEQLVVKDVAELKTEKDFLKYYLELIQHTCDIDIGDFEIPSKGGFFGKPMAKFKRLIWVMLRFYTYRLFSQQKEFNFQLVNTIMSLNKRIDELEKKLEESTSK